VIGTDSSARSLAKLVASIPTTVDPSTVRACITAYYASYATGDLSARESLFADPCHFEDPAGHVVATDRASLHRFFTETIPANWSIDFRLDRVAVVGNEALATSTMTLRAAQRTPADVIVNAHFVISDSGLIHTVRTFFDEESMKDSTPWN
jgi:ketosteroid isomerase-like protein